MEISMTSWSISRYFSLVFAKPVRNFKIVCFFSFSLSTRMIYYSNAIFLALVFSSIACYKDHWLRSFSKDDTLCPLLNGCPFVGGPFVGSSRSIQRLIDRRLHTCWPECAQESGEQEKERDAEDRKEAGRESTWLTNCTGEWRDAFARGWKVSFRFRSLFLYIWGSNWQEKRSRRACDYPSGSKFACSLRVSCRLLCHVTRFRELALLPSE